MAVAGRPKWGMIRPFLFLFALHCLAIYLFTRGFLLTRTELAFFSRCSDNSDSPCFRPFSRSSNDSGESNLPLNEKPKDPGCWTRPAVDRFVIIVLDALRFDFVAPSTFFKDKKPWMDKLQVLQKLASEDLSARIFKAIADPPTTSLQRLKGLTTGGLPTFIDVGNSFGAPAIVEDNLIHQLFPDHFNTSYPYPSFNVKDLDTVDDGVIEHLIPSLYKEDWDVLIAHFLGVDHAGHIFGVDSPQIIQKLEQYNSILEEVVNVLKNQSGPGGLHENTFLIVMGDHGQTTNGDHGGGTPEEVETSLFAMSLQSPPPAISLVSASSFCHADLVGKRLCIGIFEQLDFAVTISALLGLPFPFGSIGRVNAELYALSPRTWEGQGPTTNDCQLLSDITTWLRFTYVCVYLAMLPSAHVASFELIFLLAVLGELMLNYMHLSPRTWEGQGPTTNDCQLLSDITTWKQNYVNALCINCWQVKRYIDLYSSTSVIGLPYVAQLYNLAQINWSVTVESSCLRIGTTDNTPQSTELIFLQQIDAYSDFLKSVAKLARSAWTEFDMRLMGIGLGCMLVSLIIHLLVIMKINFLYQSCYNAPGIFSNYFNLVSAFLLVVIRAVSFLSNSYILAEGSVAAFLLSTIGILRLWCSISKWKFPTHELLFLFLSIIIRHGIITGMSKETSSSAFLFSFSKFIFRGDKGESLLMIFSEIFPIILLSVLAIMFNRFLSQISFGLYFRYILYVGTICSYILIALHWVSESNLMPVSTFVQYTGGNIAPRVVYATGFGLLVLSVIYQNLDNGSAKPREKLSVSALALFASWSPTIVMLLGRRGPFAILIFTIGAWCIVKSCKEGWTESKSSNLEVLVVDPITVIQWSLLAVCLFFYTGHWCAFDGLRYGAAFIGFDHFNIIRQGLLLAIDTFGASHILPILGIPFIIILQLQNSKRLAARDDILCNVAQIFLIYGLITATTTTFMIVCVAIQRRHLMVWGLFAPKYVFHAVGLLLTDALIFMASVYYY